MIATKTATQSITWQDVQFAREQDLYQKLHPVLERLKSHYSKFAQKSQQQEKEFFMHLSHSVRIDRLENIAALLDRINRRLNIDLNVTLFLFQSPISNAMCTPRSTIQSVGQKKELVILVSQHFLNELSPAEQSSILGHELGHLLFGHVLIPANLILNSQFQMKDIQDLKNDVLKWKTCAEVSCDMLGFLSCDCNVEASQSALLKYTTGLTSSTIQAVVTYPELIDLIHQQFEEISSSVYDPAMSTHPLTPLRLQIIEAVADSQLIRHYGQPVSPETLQAYRAEYNALIDAQLEKIYPEFISDKQGPADNTLFELCIAVALSDGQISREEITAIGGILGHENCCQYFYESVQKRLSEVPAEQVVREIIGESVRKIRQKNCPKPQIFKMLRHLLVVAASDTKIESGELDAIYAFAREFGVTKQEIGILIAQMGLC